MVIDKIRNQAIRASRRLLSEQNRDPYTLSYGCFDRRFWSWKLTDFPDATFQRNVYSLAWYIKNPDSDFGVEAEILTEAVQAGLTFSARIQHRDGSFDQAFPYEHSFGATAFLLSPLLDAYQIVKKKGSPEFQSQTEDCLRRAADFLCRNNERHGLISNHLAGAALAMLRAGKYFGDARYTERARVFLRQVLEYQSPEGWFLEYDGADPGYQTLCLYYLAKIHQSHPEPRLKAALERAVEFLTWFTHPDGTFGGEYGSRRTAIFYPGGLTLLAHELPSARSLTRFMLTSIARGQTINLDDIDMGNTAPLLENYLTVLGIGDLLVERDNNFLPLELEQAGHNFPKAGLYVRGTSRYYAILGTGNGGVLKVFDRREKKLIWNDSGYVGQTTSGDYITSQMIDLKRPISLLQEEISLETPFYSMIRSMPSPEKFIILRVLNLTVLRSKGLGNLAKRWLVKALISGRRFVPLKLTRTVRFGEETVTVSDRIEGRLPLRWLEYGQPFVTIHMASARYFESATGNAFITAKRVDVAALNAAGKIECRVTI